MKLTKSLKKYKNNVYIRSSIALVFFQYVFFALNFAGQILLARMIAPEIFGTIAIVLAIVNMINMTMSMAVSYAYVNSDDSDSIYDSAMFISMANWLVIFIVTLLISIPLSMIYGAKFSMYIILITLFKLFDFIRVVIFSDLEKKLNFKRGALILGLSSSSSLVISLALAYHGFAEASLLAREIGLSVISIILTLYFTTYTVTLSKRNNLEIRAMLEYSSKTIMARLSEAAFFKAPIIICERLFSIQSTGFFSQSLYLIQTFNSALSPFTQKVAFVYYSRNKGNAGSSGKVNLINAFLLLLALPFSLTLWFLSGDILVFLWGESWRNGSDILKWMSPMLVLLPIFHNLKSLMFGHSKQLFTALSLILGLVSFVILSFYIAVDYQISVSFMLSTSIAVTSMLFLSFRGNNEKP